MVKLRRPFSWGEDLSEGRDDDELQKCIDCEFELATDNVYSTLYEFRQSDAWHVALPALLNEFEQLLRDALDLMHAFGEASEQKDPRSGFSFTWHPAPASRFSRMGRAC